MHYFQGLREHRPPWGPNCSLLTDTGEGGGGEYLDIIYMYIFFQQFKGKIISLFMNKIMFIFSGSLDRVFSTRYFLPIHRIIKEKSDVMNMLVRVISRV